MREKTVKPPVPSESVEQINLFRWAIMQRGIYPELDLMHHIPNGGVRHQATAKRLKAEGVKAGVPDVMLPVARGGYYGMYIEMKKQAGGKLTESQSQWISALNEQGYHAIVSYGWRDAADEIEKYLCLGR